MNAPVADAARGNWVDRAAPARWRPYLRMARIDRPIGWYLLLLPCWQGLALAISATGLRVHDPWLVLAFLIGAVAMRGAGCCLNDIADRDIDAQVARTRSRPIPSGQISVGAAAVFMLGLCLVGLAVLLTMNRFAIMLGFAAVLPAVIYPFMKRITWWPQLFLGLAFNWGALLGWAAHTGGLGWAPVLLYLHGICWTIGYDTIYAHQDREDDALIGVKSTARLFGARTRRWLALFYGLAVVLAGAAGAVAGLGPLFWAGLAVYAGLLAWQVRALDIDDGEHCLMLFKANARAGFVLVVALLAGAI